MDRNISTKPAYLRQQTGLVWLGMTLLAVVLLGIPTKADANGLTPEIQIAAVGALFMDVPAEGLHEIVSNNNIAPYWQAIISELDPEEDWGFELLGSHARYTAARIGWPNHHYPQSNHHDRL